MARGAFSPGLGTTLNPHHHAQEQGSLPLSPRAAPSGARALRGCFSSIIPTPSLLVPSHAKFASSNLQPDLFLPHWSASPRPVGCLPCTTARPERPASMSDNLQDQSWAFMNDFDQIMGAEAHMERGGNSLIGPLPSGSGHEMS